MRAIWETLTDFGVTSDDLGHIDLYSCFPTVVQSACDVLDIDAFDPSRVPTITGGLTFGGGPGNNYVTHSIASMVDRLRSDSSSQGLVTALAGSAPSTRGRILLISPARRVSLGRSARQNRSPGTLRQRSARRSRDGGELHRDALIQRRTGTTHHRRTDTG